MSTPPLGVGYPDGGLITSEWGDALVADLGTSHPSGFVFFTGFVGNWSQLQVSSFAGSNAFQLQFTWYTDSTLTRVLGSNLININSADTAGVDTLMANQGPYLKITLTTTNGLAAIVSLFVIPATGVGGTYQAGVSGALFTVSGVVAAGVTLSTFIPTVIVGRGVLCLVATGGPTAAALLHFDMAGAVMGVQQVALPAGAAGNSGIQVPIIMPPCRTRLDLNNGGGAPLALRGTIIIDPR